MKKQNKTKPNKTKQITCGYTLLTSAVLILGWKYDDLVLRDPWKHCDLSHLSDDA